MSALNTDLYQLTMAAGYFAAHKTEDVATFELLVRRLPPNRNFLVTAGLQQAAEFLLNLHFDPDEIEYLSGLAQFANAPAAFFEFLAKLRFTGDLFAIPEGTPVFAGEPIAIIRAPLVQAQLVETYLLSTLGFQTIVASKAARCVIAAGDRPVVEFGSRRAHSPEAGVFAGRAAYIGGCTGTSNAEAGMRFGIPVSGTAAHSWTMSFPNEEQAFRQLQRVLGEHSVFLIDTYDTLQGARTAARVGRPLWGVRLDSGDLEILSYQVRRILDEAGLHEAKIMATNDLDENRIQELLAAGAPIDGFGVGTQLSTSADAPALAAVYKLVEIRSGESIQYTAKFSGEKSTLPGAKQIYRYPHCDEVALYEECNQDFTGEPLVRPVISSGQLVEPLPSATAARLKARNSLLALPSRLLKLEEVEPYDVTVSPRLHDLADSVRAEHNLPSRRGVIINS
jgi:nicotinate phosphoribosyltransferase